MVNLFSGVLFAIFAAANRDPAPHEAITVCMVVVEAKVEGRKEKYYDPALKSVRDGLSELPFDTYRKYAVSQTRVPFGKEAEIPIDKKYTLYITPLSERANGQIRIKARIQMERDPPDKNGKKKKPVNTHVTTTLLKPGRKLKFGGGLKSAEGELIVVISLEKRPAHPPKRPRLQE